MQNGSHSCRPRVERGEARALVEQPDNEDVSSWLALPSPGLYPTSHPSRILVPRRSVIVLRVPMSASLPKLGPLFGSQNVAHVQSLVHTRLHHVGLDRG